MTVCTYPGCGQICKARGLCGAHYQQQRRGIALRPVRHPATERPGHACECAPSATCYSYHACRCEACCEAHSRKHKAWRHAGPSIVDGAGTVRRLRALCRVGWSRAEIGVMLGIDKSNIEALIAGRERVTKRTRTAVRRAYDTNWQGPPKPTTGTERARRTRALRAAERRGWVLPMQWDDDLGPHGIDNPAATPHTLDEGPKPHGQTASEVRQMLGTDSAEGIAKRLGYSTVDVLAITLGRTDKALADRLREAQIIRRIA